MLALLTIMAAGYSATMRIETRLTARQLHAAQGRALAEAGVWLAVNDLLQPDLDKQWAVDGTANDLQLYDGAVELSIQDQAGMIDLNTARDELLRALFESRAIETDVTSGIVDAILDWRDRDDLTRSHGAEAPEYRLAGSTYPVKNGPFNSIDELRLVMGMTEEIYQQVYPALTIYSHLPGINPVIAPATVLLSLPGTDPDGIDQYLSQRSDPAAVATNTVIPGVNSIFTNQSKGVSFMINSVGIMHDARVELEVVISLRRTSELPYTILAWREI